MKSYSEYLIPINIFTLDTPVLTVPNEERLAFQNPLSYNNPIKVCQTEDRNIKSPYIGAIYSIPEYLLREDVCKIIEAHMRDVFLRLGRSYIQFLDVQFSGISFPDSYKIMHVMNEIKCMNLTESEFEAFDDEEDELELMTIDKLVLDEKVLSSIPAEERQIFRLKEHNSTILFSKNLAEKISLAEPNDVKFIPVNEWTCYMDEERY